MVFSGVGHFPIEPVDIVPSEDNEPVQKPAHRVLVAMKEKFKTETKENWNDQYITCTLLGFRFMMPLLVEYKICQACARCAFGPICPVVKNLIALPLHRQWIQNPLA